MPAYGETKAQEMAYLAELSEGWYAITNPVRQVGLSSHFDPTLFRYVWYWQRLGDVAQGYPGGHLATALGPGPASQPTA
ncbi:MAG: hypothetical protein U0401_23640 [Anaerolineae bacterium]